MSMYLYLREVSVGCVLRSSLLGGFRSNRSGRTLAWSGSRCSAVAAAEAATASAVASSREHRARQLDCRALHIFGFIQVFAFFGVLRYI